MSEHTKEPWHVMETGFGNKAQNPVVYATGDELIYITSCEDFASMTRTDNLANARRIVACVNACEGMNTLYLENFGNKESITDYLRNKFVNEELLAALKEISEMTYDAWTNGAKAAEIAKEAIAKAEASHD